MRRARFRAFLRITILVCALPFTAMAQQAPPASGPTTAAVSPAEQVQDRGWPRTFETDQYKIVVHQPQVDKWPDFERITFRAAISIAAKGDGKPEYGMLLVSAATQISVANRLVMISDRKIELLGFPDASDADNKRFTAAVAAAMPPEKALTISLDRIITQLEFDQVKVRQVDVNLAPPKIFASDKPAIMVTFMGKPRFKPVAGSDLLFAINTNWDLFLDPGASLYYLLSGKSWLVTDNLAKGAWVAATSLPAGLSKLPPDDNWNDVRASLPLVAAKESPTVFISFEPAELIVTKGSPELRPIPGTRLMAVANTENDLFFNNTDKQFYLLAAGRWFKAAALSGPWTAASASLPGDFQNIPENSEFADVLVSVPGADAAREAAILASIPEKATISRTGVTVNVTYDGPPQFKPIETTTVQYAYNTPYSVFLVEGKYYCCYKAVWFVSSQPTGPWVVCDSVPKAIYTIPPSSSKHNVTYVRVYESTPTTVVMGYTAGYRGETVATTGAVMYGTGVPVGVAIADDDYCHYHYHSGYVSYGYGVHYHSGYGGYAASGSNAYGSWGRAEVTNGDDWVRGGYNSGANGSVRAIEGSGGAAAIQVENKHGETTVARTKDGDVYAGKDGNVYKKTDSGWQQQGAGQLRSLDGGSGQGAAATPARAAATGGPAARNAPQQSGYRQQEAAARDRGDQRASRTQQFQRSGGSSASRSGGGRRGGGRR